MTLRVSDKEYEAVRRLPSRTRLEYLVKRVADQRAIWGLRTAEGWAIGTDDDGHEVFPVWPHPRFAEASATGAWAGAEPGRIALGDWLGKWTSGLTADDRLVGVFPTDQGDEAAIAPLDLAAAIREEQRRFG